LTPHPLRAGTIEIYNKPGEACHARRLWAVRGARTHRDVVGCRGMRGRRGGGRGGAPLDV